MSGVLFLCHRLPYPPNKGDKIRSYHILKKLSKEQDVYLGAFIDDPLDWTYVKHVRSLVKDICVVERRNVRHHWPNLITGIFQGKALSNVLYDSPQMKLWVDQLIASQVVSKAYVFSSTMAQYMLPHKGNIPWITDFVDVDSHKWTQYAHTMSFPMNMLYHLESRRLKIFESQVANVSETNIFVSHLEAQLFKQIIPLQTKPVVSIQNGVDTQFFNPHAYYSNPYQGDKIKIVFTGLMNYWPNVDAVKWFTKEVFQPLRGQFPNIEFYIVGANPNKSVFQLKGKGVQISGRVPDIRPYLQHADIVVAPLRIARGIQNKVLEAMSMNKVIVASFEALEGIPIPPHSPIWQESSPQAWLERLLKLCHREQVPNQETHSWIEANFSWEAHLSQIDPFFKPLKAG